MLCLVSEEGMLVKNSKQVLEIQEMFYHNLYMKDSSVKFNIYVDPTLRVPQDIVEKENLPITISDLSNAVEEMPNQKTPSTPIDFYKVFWSCLKVLLYDI